jgi:hypothetical protein
MDEVQRFAVVKIPPLEGALRIVIELVTWAKRRIRPSHGGHVTGRFPLGKGRGSVPYESRLECSVMAWLASYEGLTDLKSQPVTVEGWFDDTRVVYTTDIYVAYDPLPKPLEALGFGPETLIEVKPLKHGSDLLVFQKLAVVSMATGMPALLVTELK